MSIVELERRLVTLEQQVGHLVRKAIEPNSKDINSWIDEIHGTFQNNPAYRKAARAGRQWRKSKRAGSSRPRKAASK